MPDLALTSLMLALVAAVFGFTGSTVLVSGVAKVLFPLFFALFLVISARDIKNRVR